MLRSSIFCALTLCCCCPTLVVAQPVAIPLVNPNPARIGEPILFDGSRSVGPDRIVDYFWLLGDGRGVFAATLNYAYFVPGPYFASLEVTDETGRRGFAGVQVDVINQSPIAAARGPSLREGDPLMLDASGSVDPDGPFDMIRFYQWDLNNDGRFDVETPDPRPVVFFAQYSTLLRYGENPGTLQVSDQFGGQGFAGFSINLSPVPVPEPSTLFLAGMAPLTLMLARRLRRRSDALAARCD